MLRLNLNRQHARVNGHTTAFDEPHERMVGDPDGALAWPGMGQVIRILAVSWAEAPAGEMARSRIL